MGENQKFCEVWAPENVSWQCFLVFFLHILYKKTAVFFS